MPNTPGKKSRIKTNGYIKEGAKSKMRIITINLPIVIIEAIKALCGDKYGLYPSRSELIRVATIERVRHDMELLNDLSKNIVRQHDSELDTMKVRVPKGDPDEHGDYHEFKTYNIVRRLEY